MNKKQRGILIAAMVAVVAMAFFPPFQFRGKEGIVISLGYGWLFDPPKHGFFPGAVDIAMLLTQWVGVAIVTAIGYFLTKYRWSSG